MHTNYHVHRAPHQVSKQTCGVKLKEVPYLQLALIALKPQGKCMIFGMLIKRPKKRSRFEREHEE